MAQQAPITIGGLVFDRSSYDVEGDVLYLHIGDPQPAAGADETSEGHIVRYDTAGRVIGLTLINARWLVQRDGAVTVTLPQARVAAEELAPALGLAS